MLLYLSLHDFLANFPKYHSWHFSLMDPPAPSVPPVSKDQGLTSRGWWQAAAGRGSPSPHLRDPVNLYPGSWGEFFRRKTAPPGPLITQANPSMVTSQNSETEGQSDILICSSLAAENITSQEMPWKALKDFLM